MISLIMYMLSLADRFFVPILQFDFDTFLLHLQCRLSVLPPVPFAHQAIRARHGICNSEVNSVSHQTHRCWFNYLCSNSCICRSKSCTLRFSLRLRQLSTFCRIDVFVWDTYRFSISIFMFRISSDNSSAEQTVNNDDYFCRLGE